MSRQEEVTLLRDIEAVQVPFGEKVPLAKGSRVRITQALGGTYTVVTEYGNMMRIAAGDADALGQETKVGHDGEDPLEGEALEQALWEQMKSCYDPEIPVNIVDLGLVYSCKVEPGEEGRNKVEVIMTLTAPGCGMGPVIADDVKQKVLTVPGVAEAHVEVVFEPQWDRDMMSEAARLQLGM